jgi:hypothetical protein
MNRQCQDQNTTCLLAKTKTGATDRGFNPRISGMRATEKTQAMNKTDNTTNTLQAENCRQLHYKGGSTFS